MRTKFSSRTPIPKSRREALSYPVQGGILQVFDVDHGQCALLTMPMPSGAEARVMIDCGHSSRSGQQWCPGEKLAGAGVKHLDLLVITNCGEDHASGFPNLIKQGI